MKKIILTLSVILFWNFLHAQVTLQKTFGGTGGESGNDIHQTADGGFIIAGYTSSFGNLQDGYLIKLDSNYDVTWATAYGGTSNDYFRSVSQTADGGYIATGSTNSFGSTDNNLYLVKTDGNGQVQWSKTYNGASEEIGNAVKQTADGGYIIAGNYGLASLYLVRTDSIGDTLWTKTLNGAIGWSVIPTSDNGFIVGGEILAAGTEAIDFYMVKTNSAGDTLWTRIFGGTGDDVAKDIIQTNDGGFVMAGSTTSFGAGGSDVYLVKTDSVGNLLWSKTFGGTGSDAANAVEQTSDGGFIVTGSTGSFGAGMNDVFLVKTDDSGIYQWSRTYGGTGGETGFRARQTTDSGFVVISETLSFGLGPSDIYLIKTESMGNAICYQGNPAALASAPATQALIFSKQTGYGGAVASPATVTTSGFTASAICSTAGIDPVEIGNDEILVYPDPFSSEISIAIKKQNVNHLTITINNTLGQKIFFSDESDVAADHIKTIDTGFLSKGIYLIEVIIDGERIVKKITRE